MPSSTVEDYLKCIYSQALESGKKRVPMGQIAAALAVAPGTVTAMVKTLSGSGLVAYEPYSGVRLTAQGHKLAAKVLRRHRVVELFLVEVLGMSWSEVHGDAELLEHAVSDRLIERMDAVLKSPRFDPHGDPIPDAEGIIAKERRPNLLACPLGVPLRLARVLDQRSGFLELLESRGLVLGGELVVLARNAGTDTVDLKPPRGETLSLGSRAASRVLVELRKPPRRRP